MLEQTKRGGHTMKSQITFNGQSVVVERKGSKRFYIGEKRFISMTGAVASAFKLDVAKVPLMFHSGEITEAKL